MSEIIISNYFDNIKSRVLSYSIEDIGLLFYYSDNLLTFELPHNKYTKLEIFNKTNNGKDLYMCVGTIIGSIRITLDKYYYDEETEKYITMLELDLYFKNRPEILKLHLVYTNTINYYFGKLLLSSDNMPEKMVVDLNLLNTIDQDDYLNEFEQKYDQLVSFDEINDTILDAKYDNEGLLNYKDKSNDRIKLIYNGYELVINANGLCCNVNKIELIDNINKLKNKVIKSIEIINYKRNEKDGKFINFTRIYQINFKNTMETFRFRLVSTGSEYYDGWIEILKKNNKKYIITNRKN